MKEFFGAVLVIIFAIIVYNILANPEETGHSITRAFSPGSPPVEQNDSNYTKVKINERGERSDELPSPVSIPPRPDTVIPTPVVPDTATMAEPASDSVTFFWNYLGKNYTLTIGISDKLYQAYKQEKTAEALVGNETVTSVSWQERYNAKTLLTKPGDNSIIELTNGLKKLALQNRLTDDGLVELTASFFQKAIVYLKESDAPHKFPYVTLKEKIGDCDDKSLLGYKLLSQLGFGVCLYKMPNHMALGIASNDPSGFSYLETTNYYQIGVVPDWAKNLARVKITLLPKTGKKY